MRHKLYFHAQAYPIYPSLIHNAIGLGIGVLFGAAVVCGSYPHPTPITPALSPAAIPQAPAASPAPTAPPLPPGESLRPGRDAVVIIRGQDRYATLQAVTTAPIDPDLCASNIP